MRPPVERLGVPLSRRRFLAAALGVGAATAIPAPVLGWARAAVTATADQGGFFLHGARWQTCAALCGRIVPTGADPATAPGADQADAVLFIDRFLAAFELPASVASNPAIWLRGRFSGRNPYPNDDTGRPSARYPADAMLANGTAQFLPLDGRQQLAWRARLYGPTVLTEAAKGHPALAKWAGQASSGLIPGLVAGGLRQLYTQGLDAFNEYSEQLFHVPYYQATPTEQDLMLDAAANPALGQAPLPYPAPPPAASALFPELLVHTFQGCYSLPEYRWTRENPLWAEVGWDGDTQPLGNSIYDENLAGPGEGPNAGFGERGVYLPRGDYRQYRPVSTLGPDPEPLTEAEVGWLLPILRGTFTRSGGTR